MTTKRTVRVSIIIALAAACDRPMAKPTVDATAPPPPPASAGAAGPSSAAAAATPSASSSPPPAGIAARFDDEPVGASSKVFEAVVGEWSIGDVGSARGYQVDGAKWREGTPSVGLADQAKRLYGDRYAEFLDGVKAFAFFPLAVHRDAPPPGDFRAKVRFHPIAGKVDQAAGIAFAIAIDGSYLGVRANALEDNLLYFKVVKGKRTVIDTIRNVPTATRTWHTLALEVRGTRLVAEVDGTKRLDKTLDAAPAGGRVGLWSKADSVVMFDDFEVSAL